MTGEWFMKTTCLEVVQAALGPAVERKGAELLWHCPVHGTDKHPSLSINPRKDKWLCGPCGAGGSAWKLAAFLARCDPSDKTNVVIFLRSQGLLSKSKPTAVAVYEYTNATGGLLYQVVRNEPGKNGERKDFSQRRPDGRGRFVWNLRGITPVLYRLPDLRQADEVLLVEGEKCVDAIRNMGFVGTCNSGGAGRWREEYNRTLAGKHVVVFPDNDPPGEAHADTVVRNLIPVAKSVKILRLPGLPPKGDVADWVAAGGTKEQLREIIEATPVVALNDLPTQPRVTTEARSKTDSDQSSRETHVASGRGPSQATRLLDLTGDLILFHTPKGKAFAQVPLNGHAENWPLRSGRFRALLTGRFFASEKRAANSQAIQDAIAVLDAKATFEGELHDVFVRVGRSGASIYLDLGDPEWNVVEVTPHEWKMVKSPAVKFRRPVGMLPLPVPLKGGDVSELRALVNIGSDEQWILFLAWVLAAMKPEGPYPILSLNGEQGSAKTTAARIARNLIDPSQASIRTRPRDERDLLIAASHSHVVALDNLSKLDWWLSDALCRLSTGGGFSTRQLWTDEDEVIFEAVRPVILNGIEELTDRSDLADRSVLLTLPVITTYVEERVIWERFNAAWPRVLGSLVEALSLALRNCESVVLNDKPRMADFAVWASAAETALGFEAGDFMSAYLLNRESSSKGALESSVVGTQLLEFMVDRDSWEGTVTELFDALNSCASDDLQRQRVWPRSARALSNELSRIAPNLRSAGLDVSRPRRESNRRLWRLDKLTSPSYAAKGDDLGSNCDAVSDRNKVTATVKTTNPDGRDASDARRGGYSEAPTGSAMTWEDL